MNKNQGNRHKGSKKEKGKKWKKPQRSTRKWGSDGEREEEREGVRKGTRRNRCKGRRGLDHSALCSQHSCQCLAEKRDKERRKRKKKGVGRRARKRRKRRAAMGLGRGVLRLPNDREWEGLSSCQGWGSRAKVAAR